MAMLALHERPCTYSGSTGELCDEGTFSDVGGHGFWTPSALLHEPVPEGGPVSRLSATIQHVASRRITAPRLATSLSKDVTVQGKVAQGVMNWCGWHGMQEIWRQLGRRRPSTSRHMASAPTPGLLAINSRGPSAVEVAASPPTVRLWPELAFQLHQAPNPSAVGAQVGLDVGGRFLDRGQVDAEQLRTLRQRRRDRPAQVRVLPSPHWSRVSNTGSKSDREY